MRKSKSIASAVAAVFIATSCTFHRLAPPSTPPTALFMTSEVMQSIFEIQREYSSETVKCLTGFVDASGVVYVMSLEPAWLNWTTSESASFRECTYDDTIAWYHNHPSYTYGGSTYHVCEFSEPDLTTHEGLGLAVSVISCDAKTIVWKFRGDPRTYSWSGEVPPPERR